MGFGGSTRLGGGDRPEPVRGVVGSGAVRGAASGTCGCARLARIGLVTLALDPSGRG